MTNLMACRKQITLNSVRHLKHIAKFSCPLNAGEQALLRQLPSPVVLYRKQKYSFDAS